LQAVPHSLRQRLETWQKVKLNTTDSEAHDMKCKGLFLAFLALAICTAAPSVLRAASPDAILGIWVTSDEDARIEIYRCGQKYCGRIKHLDDPYYPPHDRRGMGGQPRVDRNNPDPELRDRPMVGLTFIRDFQYTGDNSWEGGRIYNPDNGKLYRANISLADEDHLLLRGYLGISILGRTETWVRWTGDSHSEAKL